MYGNQHPTVAVLLTTYNGARYVHEQIKSLKENRAPFILHWLDDHSTDNTRELVRASARSAEIELREWHQERRMGMPGTSFKLLECVEADIYLFCDQDDIWQPGKIDATVKNLLSELDAVVLCFSDSLMFWEDRDTELVPLSEFVDSTAFLKERDACRMFIPTWTPGHSQGFTRPLRELFLRHIEIARAYAGMHDWWMYNIAIAAGTARILRDAPVALYRQHRNSWCATSGIRKRVQMSRRFIARHAQGFILASSTLPATANLANLLRVARPIADLDRRHSPAQLIRLMRPGVNLFRKRGLVFDFCLAASLLVHTLPA